MRPAVLALAVALALALGSAAASSPYVRYGVQDDAWIVDGPGTLASRLDRLQALGVEVVRFNLRWDQIARTRPAHPRNPDDPAYRWGAADAVVAGLLARGIRPLLTLVGTPRWANGFRSFNYAPVSKWTFASFAYAAARRYPRVRDWLIWNEPNHPEWFRPTSPRRYAELLNVAYAAIHRAIPHAVVAGGASAPRANAGGVSPLDWIAGMAHAHARLDAYAHNPYPSRPQVETPFSGGCDHCRTITMATLGRLLKAVRDDLGSGMRVWLTEYGYQTDPPDHFLGVSWALQARYVGEAALRAFLAPRVDVLIHFMVKDDTRLAGWQSGLLAADGVAKPAYRAFMLPFAQVSRTGMRTVVWGQVRPGEGRRPYRLQQRRGGRWHWVGPARSTSPRGFFRRAVRAGAGSRLRIWSPREHAFGPALVVS